MLLLCVILILALEVVVVIANMKGDPQHQDRRKHFRIISTGIEVHAHRTNHKQQFCQREYSPESRCFGVRSIYHLTRPAITLLVASQAWLSSARHRTPDIGDRQDKADDYKKDDQKRRASSSVART